MSSSLISRHHKIAGALALVLAIVAAPSACSSSSKHGAADSGTGVSLDLDGSTGIEGGATNPPPIDPSNTNGWIDITQDQRAAFVGAGCDGWSAEPEGLPSVLEFVLDVSGTMRATTDTTGGLSKWEVCRDALRTALGTMPGTVSVGLEFFPNMDNGGAIAAPTDHTPCIDHGNDVAPAPLGVTGSAQRTALDGALGAVTPDPNAATPTHDALDYAYGLLRPDTTTPSKYVVLITDGQPTLAEGCYGMADPRQPDDTAPIIAAIGNELAASGIKTFVVGSPGSESNQGTGADVRDWLSAAARAGGTATDGCSDSGPNYCHFDLTQAPDFGVALSGALGTITDWVLSCDYTLPTTSPDGQSIDPNAVNLIYTDGTGQSHLLLPNGDPNCTVGWHYLDPPTYSQIHVCGSTCDTLTNDPQASFDLVFGCASGQVPVLR